MFKRIIVPVDGSELSRNALAVADVVAARTAASLVLVSVVTGREPLPDADALAALAAAAAAPVGETRVIFDENPGERLAEFVRSQPDSLVCCSTHGRGAIRQIVVGSVASAIVRDGGRPVLLVGPRHDASRSLTDGPVLVGLDGSSFGEAAVPVARDWAATWGTSVVLTQVVSPIAEAPTAQARIPAMFVAPDGYLPSLASSLPDDVTWVVTAHERPAAGLLEVVGERGASLVALATHGETGLGRVALGSVATALVCSSPVPVLVVRPEGLTP